MPSRSFLSRLRAPALLATVGLLLTAGAASARTFVVTNTNNAGPGSLRQAIHDANDSGGGDVIAFNIPGPGPFVISVTSRLPPFDDGGGVVVDGTTQPGYHLRPRIGTGGTVGVDRLGLPQIRSPIVQIFGNGLAVAGLSFLGGNNSTLRGLHVWGFRTTNVAFIDCNNATLEQNLIGADAAFADPGADLRADINVLLDGGNNPAVSNNLVGYANTPDNVLITTQRSQVLVDGNELVGSLRLSAEPTLVSLMFRATNRAIVGNLIRDSAGYGIDLVGGLENFLIADNTVRNNGSGGVRPAGIRLTNDARDSTRDNTIHLNIVHGNAGAGILVTGDSSSTNRGNTISRNSIYANGGIAIDLGGEASSPLTGDGPTPNDRDDRDDGGNELFNFPVIENATVVGGVLIVSGWSGGRTVIEFFAEVPGQSQTFIGAFEEGSFADLDPAASTYGPGPINGRFWGSDSADRFRFVIPLPSGLPGGSVLTATATAPGGTASTSEFGGAVPIRLDANLRISKTGPLIATPGATIVYSLVVTNTGPNPASGVSVADPTPPGLTFVSNASGCTTPFPCALGTVQPGQSVTISATFAVPSGYSGPNPIVNTATVSSAATDPDPTNNAASASTIVSPPRADLGIVKGRPLRRSAGASLDYAIVVTNHGPSDAPNATAADPTPAGLTFVSNGGACTTAFPCSLGPIPAGQSRTITTRFLVPSNYAGPDPIVNTATVSTTALDPDPANNSATATTAVGPLFTINVEINKVGPARVTPGTHLVYAITVTNSGTLDATNVTVTDPTPAGLTFVGNAGACTTPFPCSLGTIPAGDSRLIATAFFVPSGYSGPNPVANTATVTTGLADEDPADNQATATTPIATPSTDLSITKSGPAGVTAPATVTYVIQVTNHGPSDATAVVVSDVTPAGLTFVGNSGDCQTPFPCALGTLPASQSRSIQATFAVPPSLGPVSIVNTASVSTTAIDLDPGNDSASTTTLVTPASADLSITKSGTAEAQPGSTVSYVLAVQNAGPSDAQNVTVDDPAPAGLTFVSNSGACATPFPCSLGVLPSGQTRAITTIFRVEDTAAAGPVVNRASLSSSTPDPVLANNTAEFSTDVSGVTQADMGLTKRASSSGVAPGGTITYLLVANNAGPDPAADVSITDPIPSGAVFVSASPSAAGTCTTPPAGAGTVRCAWSGPTAVGPEGERTVVLVLRVAENAAPGTSILNAAQVTTTSSDPAMGNNSASALTTVEAPVTAVVDLAITKSRPLRRSVGASLDYTIVVSNNGPGDAPDVTVADPTPPGLTFVGNSGGCVTAFPCSLGTLPAGQSVVIASRFAVPSDYAGPDIIVNTATVTTTATDSDLANNSATVTTAIAPALTANVEITKTGPASVTPGHQLVYLVAVGNTGAIAATDVTVTDPTPPGLTFVGNSGACTTAFPCALGTIPAGESRSIVATFAVPPAYAGPSPIANTVTVTTTIDDADPSDNQAMATTPVATASTDLAITKSGPAGATPGTNITYTIQVTNDGPSNASGVVVNDPTPPGLTFVANTGDCATAFPCALGTMPSGSTRTITSTFAVPLAHLPSTPIVNTASVSSATSDPATGNNTATTTTGPVYSRYFPEGASGFGFFQTTFALFNPADADATVMLRFQRDGGLPEVTSTTTVPARRQVRIAADTIPGLDGTSFSAVIVADQSIVASRTMTWDVGRYGSHVGRGLEAPQTAWYFAEGALDPPFTLFYLFQNPGDVDAQVAIRFLRTAPGEPIERTLVVPARSRVTQMVDAGWIGPVGDVAAHIVTTNDVPIAVERSMYFDSAAQLFEGGISGEATAARAHRWEFAEVTSGPFFDLYLLLANADATAAEVVVRYVSATGETLDVPYVVEPRSRRTIWVNQEDDRVASESLAVQVLSANGVPIVAERTMWWSAGQWYEGHSSLGTFGSNLTWAVAGAEIDSLTGAGTHLLIHSSSGAAGQVRVTVVPEDGSPGPILELPIGAGRVTLRLGDLFAGLVPDGPVGVIVESIGSAPVPIVVEASTYQNAGVAWGAGASMLATPIP
jgi:uncharacterized repeat protein (TIGR01451 family)